VYHFIAIFTHATRERAHSSSCGPSPKEVVHLCTRLWTGRPKNHDSNLGIAVPLFSLECSYRRLMPRLRISGNVLPLPDISSWSRIETTFTFLFLFSTGCTVHVRTLAFFRMNFLASVPLAVAVDSNKLFLQIIFIIV